MNVSNGATDPIVWEAEGWALLFSLVSESAVPLLGYPVAQWRSEERFLEKHVHPQDWSRLLGALYRAVASGRPQSCEHRMWKADGAMVWVQTTVHQHTGANGEPAFRGVTADATVMKEEQSALRAQEGRSEEHCRLLIDSVEDCALFMISPEGLVESWNRGALRLEGYRAHEVIGSHYARFFPPDEVEKGTAGRLLQDAARSGDSCYEGWLVRKDGSRFWGLLNLSALDDDAGRLRGFSHIARDLTERLRGEREQAFLSEASRVLAGSLDYGVTLDKVAHLATREMARWCVVSILVGDMLQPVAYAHVDPEKEWILETALSPLPNDLALTHGLAHVVRTGRSELDPDVAEPDWVAEALGVENREVMRELGLRS